MKKIPVWIRKDEPIVHALVDDEDYEALVPYRWYLQNGYACRQDQRGGRNRKFYMHREIVGLTRAEPLRQVDHMNRDKLDNRRENLRVVSHEWNCTNVPARSGYRGVSWDVERGMWTARAQLGRRSIDFGRFESEEIAAAIVVGFWRGVDAMFEERADAAA